MARVPRGRRFTGVINLGVQQGDTLPHWEELPDGIRFMYWSKERGETTQREHLQMYVETKAPQEASWLSGRLGGYWMISKGSAQQNKDYCSKDETHLDGPWELGTSVKQGQSERLALCMNTVAKRGYEEAFAQDPVIGARFSSGMKEYDRIVTKRARGESYNPPEILVLVGPTESGKTRLAREIPSKRGVYMKDPATKWWDGYCGQQTIILDDFYGQIKYSELLTLLDGNPKQVEVKNGHVTLSNRRWVITSNDFPWNWYSFEGSKEALYNRLWDRFDAAVVEFVNGKPTRFHSRPGSVE